MSGPYMPIDRRKVLAGSAMAATALLTGAGKEEVAVAKPRRYAMKKSINLWAFPYPEKMNLEQCPLI